MRAIAWFPFYGQFPAALSCRNHPGFLAPVAHQLEYLVARLLVYPTGWQSAWGTKDIPQSLAHDVARRPLAWRELDIRYLGRTSRRGARSGEKADAPGKWANRSPLPVAQASFRLPCCLFSMDFFPFSVFKGGMGNAERIYSLELET